MQKFLKYCLIIFIAVIIFGAITNKDKKTNKNEINITSNITSNFDNANNNKTESQMTGNNIIIGIEYAVEGEDAAAFGALGISAVKPLPESINWSKMQPDISEPINYNVSDKFVKDYQNAGFSEIVFGLRTLSHANDNKATYGKLRPVPKTEYIDDYATWVEGIVERYDKDGLDDMPGLKYPVRYYEIEVEFSSYTPETVEDYIKKLEIAYKAAHKAYSDVFVAHSAFLAMTAFDSDPSSSQYEKAFSSMYIPDKHHGLNDMRKVLDHPEFFDLLNFHELGDPIMIERTVRWLNYETKSRGYSKPIIISDTSPTPFISYGRATSCSGPFLGIVIWPAKESDRCKLADYFNKILDNDVPTVKWKNNYIAGDMVKKTVIAATSGVKLINTSFTADLPILNSKIGFAGAGNGGFGGIVSEKYNFFTKKYTILEYRPGFYALKQLAEKLKYAKKITREPSDYDARIYKIETQDETFWIGWLHPDFLVLPKDSQPQKIISLPVLSDIVITEMASTAGAPKSKLITASNGQTQITLTMSPIYITIK